MTPEHLQLCLDSLEEAKPRLHGWNLRDFERGQRNLQDIVRTLGIDRSAELCHVLGRLLPRCADPDMALNNLDRFLANVAGCDQLTTLLDGRARTLETMLQLFGTSQFFSDLLIANPDYLDALRIPLRSSPSRAEMLAQLQGEVDAAFDDSAVLRAFRRFRQMQMLRIGTNDIIRDRSLEEITRDISRVADTALEVALSTSLRSLGQRYGEPTTEERRTEGGGRKNEDHESVPAPCPSRCVILAFGKLGGKELNYSSDIDLMFLYDEEGTTTGKRGAAVGNDEFFAKVAGEVVRLLSAHTDRGQAYRVDLRLRPEGQRGPLARSLASTLSYYDTLGRTWERQALIKVRPVAGNIRLGEEFLKAIEPFVYRKYLSFAEINEIKALKRRIEERSDKAGEADSDVKTGRGGIRDVEFTIQFLQLLNGGDLPEARQRNTLKALAALERVGCLTDQEYRALDDTYRFLRKIEHRLQLMFDLQTHRLPDRPDELRKLGLRMGYTDRMGEGEKGRRGEGEKGRGEDEHTLAESPSLPFSPSPLLPSSPDPLNVFLADLREKTTLNRKILEHLLHQMFTEEKGATVPEADLILDPHPSQERIQAVLGQYPFKDVQGAYHNLTMLATENVPFLSTRRCRQFLANIAPRLLRTVAESPDPDLALVNLEKVSASLGAKGVLWELFSFNPPSLKLYLELCAFSPFLSEILINNPGMIDELLDTLVLNQPRSENELRAELTELCRGAADPDPILHSFKDKELLRIGVRDLLGKDTVQETTAALSDLAETILLQIAALQYPPLVKRMGMPTTEKGRKGEGEKGREGEGSALPFSPSPLLPFSCRYALLSLGKLGGREMTYHSDLDLILIYEGDGRTVPPPGSTRFDTFELTDNFHFFSELARHIIKMASFLGPMGRLYQVDMRLRPTGKSGSLVIPLGEFVRYYEEGSAQLWERQALTRARVVLGDEEFGREVMEAVARSAYHVDWQPGIGDEIRRMRERVQASSSGRDLKRGFGGIGDIEFILQMFLIKYGKTHLELREPNTWKALDALRSVGLISVEEHATLRSCYDFLRLVESRLRIFHNRSLDELPEQPEEIGKLALRVGCEAVLGQSPGQVFLGELDRHASQTRKLFLELFKRERG